MDIEAAAPMRAATNSEPPAPHTPAPHLAASHPAIPGPGDDVSVLIVDDQRTIRAIFTRALSECGIGITTTAANGAEAIAFLHDEHQSLPDLVITDLYMDRMDGLQLMQSMRLSRNPAIRAIPVVVVTGETDETLLEIVGDMGCSVVVGKPCSNAQLQDAVSQALGIKL